MEKKLREKCFYKTRGGTKVYMKHLDKKDGTIFGYVNGHRGATWWHLDGRYCVLESFLVNPEDSASHDFDIVDLDPIEDRGAKEKAAADFLDQLTAFSEGQ